MCVPGAASRSATARPMPWAAPVTMTFSGSFIASSQPSDTAGFLQQNRAPLRADATLEGNIAAVDQEVDRGDERRIVGCEVSSAGRDFVGLARTIGQMGRAHPQLRLVLAARARAGTLRQDEA